MLYRRGIALAIVLGLVAVLVPVMFYLSQTGSSQVKQAMKYHEVQQSESTALAGMNSALCRLRGNLAGLQQFTNLELGNVRYAVTLRPTGTGLAFQNLYYIFSHCALGRHSYILMADAEQFPSDPGLPAEVLYHNVWNTIESYDINLAADVTAMENLRGQDLLDYENAKHYEMSTPVSVYKTVMLAKENLGLPKELKNDWNEIVKNLAKEKLTLVN